MDRYLDLFSVLEIKKKDFAPCRERTSKPSVRPSGDFQRHFVLYFPIELKARQFVVRQVIKRTLWLILFAFFSSDWTAFEGLLLLLLLSFVIIVYLSGWRSALRFCLPRRRCRLDRRLTWWLFQWSNRPIWWATFWRRDWPRRGRFVGAVF